MKNFISSYYNSQNETDIMHFENYLTMRVDCRLSVIQEVFKVSECANSQINDEDFLTFLDNTINILKKENFYFGGDIDLDDENGIIFKYCTKAITQTSFLSENILITRKTSYKMVMSEAFKMPRAKRISITIDEYAL